MDTISDDDIGGKLRSLSFPGGGSLIEENGSDDVVDGRLRELANLI